MQHQAPSTHPKAHLGFLGLCCGVGVSTIYLCQPLLPEMGATFGANAAAAGQVGVATQVGYAIGMLTVTPLGDIRERRGMIQRMFGMVAVALLLQACAPSLPLLLLLSATSGFMACVTHLVLPIAPDLAAPEERGKATRYVPLLRALGKAVDVALGRHITINATGAIGALLLEIDVPVSAMRAFSVVSRAGGLVGHLLEEKETHSGRAIWAAAKKTVPYSDENQS